MIANVLTYAVIMATVYLAVPLAWPTVHITLIQAATITLFAFLVKTFLSPEGPEIYLVNGADTEKQAEIKVKGEKEDCITCGGSGMEPHGHDACPSCGGTGYEN